VAANVVHAASMACRAYFIALDLGTTAGIAAGTKFSGFLL
jgi:hypothetical protein